MFFVLCCYSPLMNIVVFDLCLTHLPNCWPQPAGSFKALNSSELNNYDLQSTTHVIVININQIFIHSWFSRQLTHCRWGRKSFKMSGYIKEWQIWLLHIAYMTLFMIAGCSGAAKWRLPHLGRGIHRGYKGGYKGGTDGVRVDVFSLLTSVSLGQRQWLGGLWMHRSIHSSINPHSFGPRWWEIMTHTETFTLNHLASGHLGIMKAPIHSVGNHHPFMVGMTRTVV